MKTGRFHRAAVAARAVQFFTVSNHGVEHDRARVDGLASAPIWGERVDALYILSTSSIDRQASTLIRHCFIKKQGVAHSLRRTTQRYCSTNLEKANAARINAALFELRLQGFDDRFVGREVFGWFGGTG